MHKHCTHTPPQAAPSAIVSDAFLALLAKHQPELVWEREHEEHCLEYTVGAMR